MIGGSSAGFQKYSDPKAGGGPYTIAYHDLVGTSPWIHVTHIDNHQLTEGDLVTVFSQFGEIRDIRCVRHHRTGAFLGAAFVEYVDYRSAILASDNMNSSSEVRVRLTPVCERGIHVERCAPNEVSTPPLVTTSYAQWLQSLRSP